MENKKLNSELVETEEEKGHGTMRTAVKNWHENRKIGEK